MAEPNDDADRQNPADEGAEPSAPEPTSEPEKGATKAADPQVIKDRNRRIREEAAAKRRQKRVSEERRVAPARNLDTSEIVDDAMARTTHAAGQFLKRHFNVVQYIVLAAVVGGIGYQVYDYRHSRSVPRAADELKKAWARNTRQSARRPNRTGQYTASTIPGELPDRGGAAQGPKANTKRH